MGLISIEDLEVSAYVLYEGKKKGHSEEWIQKEFDKFKEYHTEKTFGLKAASQDIYDKKIIDWLNASGKPKVQSFDSYNYTIKSSSMKVKATGGDRPCPIRAEEHKREWARRCAQNERELEERRKRWIPGTGMLRE